MKQHIFNLTILFVVLVSLLLSMFMGFKKAQKQQISRIVLANADSLKTGLQYFYNDFERYPKALEFTSVVDMQPYFSTFPPKDYIIGKCIKTWRYERPSIDSFIVDFCLPQDYGNFSAGWQKITSY